MAQAFKDAPQPPRSQSHGRGGAGNIITKADNGPAGVCADDLATPHIKSATYTTGRGGGYLGLILGCIPTYSQYCV